MGLDVLPLWLGVSLLPFAYLIWLTTLMSILTAITSVAGLFVSKPRRATGTLHAMSPAVAYLFYQYSVYTLLESAPFLAYLLKNVAPLRWLFFRSFSTRCRLPLTTAGIYGVIEDPDLTCIDRSVLLGHGARLVAHSTTMDSSGHYLYQSAPIRIYSGATIGGDSLVELGSVIGRNSIVESCSRVSAYTVVPDGEVWGGVPASFIRKRYEAPPSDEPSAAERGGSPARSDHECRRLIASSLGVELAQITEDSGADNCNEWDSLGQMAIASALQLRYGVKLTPEQIFSLRSVNDVRSHIGTPGSPSIAIDSDPSILRDPELLPLWDSGKAMQVLLTASQPPLLSGRKDRMNIAIAASFVAEPLAQSLRLWCHAFGIEVDIEFAGFNQMTSSLLDPNSPLRRNADGINLILSRPEDLCTLHDRAGAKALESIFGAASKFVSQGGNLIVASLPPAVSPSTAIAVEELSALQLDWKARSTTLGGASAIDFAAIIHAVGTEKAADPEMEMVASTPYSREVYEQLGIVLAREVRRRRLPAKKVIALDGDGTLWDGVLGEDGIEGVKLTPGHAWFQTRLLDLKARGALLVMVSKNQPEDVWDLLDQRTDFLLRSSDFSAHRIGWNPKSGSLRELAAELNLGLDSFVFIDDNPTERAAVEATCPGVTVLPLPVDAGRYASMLNRLWCFDGLGSTAEDGQRHSMVQAEARRRDLASQNADLEDYLRSLGLEVTFEKASLEDVPRLSQLSQKTNQFNLSLNRRDEDQIRSILMSSSHRTWKVSVVDQFGNYGIVGLVIASGAESENTRCVEIDTFLLSCRALGRGVEEAILHAFCRSCRDLGFSDVIGPYQVAPRNSPVRDFFARQGFSDAGAAFRRSLLPLPPKPEHVRLIENG